MVLKRFKRFTLVDGDRCPGLMYPLTNSAGVRSSFSKDPFKLGGKHWSETFQCKECGTLHTHWTAVNETGQAKTLPCIAKIPRIP